MSSITPSLHSSHVPGETSLSEQLSAIALVAWVVGGPILAMIFEFRITSRQWPTADGTNLAQLDDIKLAYFYQAQQTFFVSTGIWIVGIGLLMYLYARFHVYQDGK